jgi:hypothetical protein
MGVGRGAIWLVQAVSSALTAAEIRYEGYKMGISSLSVPTTELPENGSKRQISHPMQKRLHQVNRSDGAAQGGLCRRSEVAHN